ITGALALGSWWVLGFVSGIAGREPATPADSLSPIYVDYQTDVDEYVSAESYLAMGNYQREHPEPQNVKVLVGLTTQEINGYMMNHFVAGLGVNCTYCHSLENFSLEVWGDPVAEANRANARRHLELVQDLNRNWLTQLDGLTDQKQPSGAQITCATCHNGAPKFNPWELNANNLQVDFRLPLGADEDLTAENQGILNVNGRTDISLDAVQYQQNVMYHMNVSMNVGCTHCHNSRYFPSREVPAIHYAQNMLQMTQYIWLNYADSMANQEPSCIMCHQQNVLPPGAAISPAVMPPALVAEGS
ncbi:MAG: photosynthetic reaction center cytochrome c subunit family protein, partial [Anaerolineae bacterium]|nr:photosynthetic reaction center cytochrome c subunit family protein [Anaerolineae bacterium]